MGGQGVRAASITCPRRGSLLALGLVALAYPFGRVGEEASCGDPSSPPNPPARGGNPGLPGELQRAAWPGSASLGLPMQGTGRVRGALEGLRLFRPKSPNRRQGQPRS